jgi:hypothetical protein
VLADSLRVLDLDLLDPLPPEMSTRSVLCCSKLCSVRGKLQSDPDCRLVRGRFRGRAFSA